MTDFSMNGCVYMRDEHTETEETEVGRESLIVKVKQNMIFDHPKAKLTGI